MADKDDKPDQPSPLEPLLRRIAEGVERLQRTGPSAMPPSIAAPDGPSAMPQDRQRFANAGNINIESPQGKGEPSVFGKAAVSLQSMTNRMADYGFSSPAMHSLTSYAKVASLMAGDQHTRGEGLAKKGLVPNAGGDQDQILRSMELMGKRSALSSGEPSESSPQIARNDLKDSIDSLKEAIDQLKETVKNTGQEKTSGKGQTIFRQSPSPKSGSPSPPRAANAGPLGTVAGLANAAQMIRAFIP